MALGLMDRLIDIIRPRRVSPMQSIGAMGTVVMGGFVEDNEKSSELIGQRRYTTYAEVIANTGIVFACLRYFLTLAGKPDWSVEPANDTAAAKKVAEFIHEALHGMKTPWKRVVRKAALYRPMGFSAQEWTAKRRDDGMIVLDDIQSRPQKTIETWKLGDDGQILELHQRSPNTSELIPLPRWKLLYLVEDDLTDSPTGLGLLRGVVPDARRLERYEQLEGYGFESDLRGVPFGKAPFAALQSQVNKGKMTAAEMQRALDPLESFIRKHIASPKTGLVLDSSVYETKDERKTPSGAPLWSLDLLKNGSTSQEAVAAAIMRLEQRMARLMGGEGLMLGSNSAGSLALARDKSSNIADVVESTLGDVAAGARSDVVAPLMQLNALPEELTPTLKARRVLGRDVEQVATVVRDMSTAGIQLMVEDDAVGEIFDAIGLTRPNPMAREMDAALDPNRRPKKGAAADDDEPDDEDDDEEKPSGR